MGFMGSGAHGGGDIGKVGNSTFHPLSAKNIPAVASSLASVITAEKSRKLPVFIKGL